MKSTKRLFIYVGLSVFKYGCLAAYIVYLIWCSFLNLTIPYKFLGFFTANFVTITCVYGGAINLLCKVRNSCWGFNTDGYGLLIDIYYRLHICTPCTVLLVGAGGAFSNIISVMLMLARFTIYLFNRTVTKYSSDLFKLPCVHFYGFGIPINLLINTIPYVGFYKFLLVNPCLITLGVYVYDITYGAYNPLGYLFSFYFFGFGMLYRQACENFKVCNERIRFKVS
ncbi:hypothetical protein JS520_00630 [Candidatus Vidania fulgoroideae]|nr:hypothetical protein JS520_00630 [Candidatus Vidania fulgoroideae]